MPANITCDLCGTETAASMVTDLANGDSIAIGPACQLTFHLTVATEFIKTMDNTAATAYEDQVTALLDMYGLTAAAASGLTPRTDVVMTADDDERDDSEPAPFDPGPEADDQGGMSEHQYPPEASDAQ